MTKRLEYEEYYIAYIDMLGSEEHIKEDIKEKCILLNIFKNVYSSCISLRNGLFKDIHINIFSDNITLTTKSSNNVDMFVKAVSYMSQLFLRRGLLPRGGICKGMLYVDDIFIIGDALLEAYDMENKYAKNPRILISDEVIDDLENIDLILLDEDDMKFLNLFIPFGRNSEKTSNNIIEIRKWFDEAYEKYKNDEKVFGKYEWMDNHLKNVENKYCEKMIISY